LPSLSSTTARRAIEIGDGNIEPDRAIVRGIEVAHSGLRGLSRNAYSDRRRYLDAARLAANRLGEEACAHALLLSLTSICR
jgi:hypothetical protein